MPVAVLHAAELLTLAGPKGPRIRDQMRELAIVRDGGMLIEDGRVVATGSSNEISKLMPAGADVVEARGKVVLPGFVDAHTHPVFAGDRVDEFEMRARGATYEEIAESGGGIRSTVRKTRAASEDELLGQARKHASWFLAGGTTTVEAKSGYGLTVDDELKMLRVIRRLPLAFEPCHDEITLRPLPSLAMICRIGLPGDDKNLPHSHMFHHDFAKRLRAFKQPHGQPVPPTSRHWQLRTKTLHPQIER